MKEGLKTLNDFELSCVFKEDLKAESVKYYKDLKEHAEMDLTTTDAQIIIGTMRWIKHFFNLTEEDLKEKEE